MLGLAALAIGCNWFVFVKAIADGYILEAGLGYYISPMFSVCLSLFFLKERLSGVQWIAVGLCLLAIVYMACGYGRIPYFGLGLAFTFGWYGLIKKSNPIMALDGVLFETMLLSPIAVLILLSQSSSVLTHFSSNNMGLVALIVATGLVTAVPQVWFAKATKSLKLSTIGFLQYLSPSIRKFGNVFYCLIRSLCTSPEAINS